MAHNDLELVADGNPRFSFDTIQDDCQVSYWLFYISRSMI